MSKQINSHSFPQLANKERTCKKYIAIPGPEVIKLLQLLIKKHPHAIGP